MEESPQNPSSSISPVETPENSKSAEPEIVAPPDAPHICAVCGKTEAVLSKIDYKRCLQLQNPVNWGLCEKDQQLFDEGYVALVEVLVPRDKKMKPGMTLEKDVSRTGKIVHLKRDLAEQYFAAPISPERPLAYISHDVIKGLQQWMEHVYSKTPK